jgi:hypothetical protein
VKGGPDPGGRPTTCRPVATEGRRGVLFCLALTALLLAPHLFTGIYRGRPYPECGLPRVYGGDEQHYLVLINSLLRDGDLDLRNNYAAVHAGDIQAGAAWAQGRALDHHTVLMLDGRPRPWQDVYDPTDWRPDADGVYPLPPVRPGVRPPADAPEYSTHQPGIAFLLAPVLYPLRGTTYLEPAALVCSGLATVLAMLFYRILLGAFTADRRTRDLVTLAAFLGTPIWFYGRSLFLEGFLVFFVVASYALALRKGQNVLPGLLLACAVQLKPHYALLALPLLGERLAQRKMGEMIRMALPLAGSVGVLFVCYAHWYGSPWRPPQPFVVGDVFEGAVGLLLGGETGLVYFTPIALAALACWPSFVRTCGRPALVLGTGFVAFYLLTASYAFWDGGFCYGPRYLVPVLPLLIAALVRLPRTRLYRSRCGKGVLAALVALSVLVNGVSVFYYWCCWSANPYLTTWSRVQAVFQSQG